MPADPSNRGPPRSARFPQKTDKELQAFTEKNGYSHTDALRELVARGLEVEEIDGRPTELQERSEQLEKRLADKEKRVEELKQELSDLECQLERARKTPPFELLFEGATWAFVGGAVLFLALSTLADLAGQIPYLNLFTTAFLRLAALGLMAFIPLAVAGIWKTVSPETYRKAGVLVFSTILRGKIIDVELWLSEDPSENSE